jgi:hypothetical protein
MRHGKAFEFPQSVIETRQEQHWQDPTRERHATDLPEM